MTVELLRDWAGLAATLLGIVGALIGFWKFRGEILKSRKQRDAEKRAIEERAHQASIEALRLNEVTHWGMGAVSAMARLAAIVEADWFDEERTKAALCDIALDLTAAIETGRLYFRNQSTECYGLEKEPAYRGYRPLILDQLVAGYEICQHWPNVDIESRRHLARAARLAQQRFTSFVQNEVGREIAKDRAAAAPGQGSPLESLLTEI